MQFEPTKSELIHFTRGKPYETPLCLRSPESSEHSQPFPLVPVHSGRFLGIWLDRKLSFTTHTKAIKRKLETQMYALTRLAAST